MKKYIVLIIFLFVSAGVVIAYSNEVYLNKKSLIYHNASCGLAKKCTVNCTWVSRTKAVSMGARPCKVCGG